MWRVLILLAALMAAVPGSGWAACQWMIDPGAIGDVISTINQGTAPDDVTFRIFDNTGTQQGGTVTSGTIQSFGRHETTVGNLYKGAHLPTTAIKSTYVLATEGTGREMIMQVSLSGGGSLQPLHFDSDFSRVADCEQR